MTPIAFRVIGDQRGDKKCLLVSALFAAQRGIRARDMAAGDEAELPAAYGREW